MKKEIFKAGRRYRAKSNFTSGSSEFIAREILTFVSGSYSPYDSSFAYEFKDADEGSKTWWLPEDRPANVWKQYFSQVGLFG